MTQASKRIIELEHELEEKENELETALDEKNVLMNELLQLNVSETSQ